MAHQRILTMSLDNTRKRRTATLRGDTVAMVVAARDAIKRFAAQHGVSHRVVTWDLRAPTNTAR